MILDSGSKCQRGALDIHFAACLQCDPAGLMNSTKPSASPKLSDLATLKSELLEPEISWTYECVSFKDFVHIVCDDFRMQSVDGN
jgi:hypothetical protein